jgi:hypothetical protein
MTKKKTEATTMMEWNGEKKKSRENAPPHTASQVAGRDAREKRRRDQLTDDAT